MAGDSTKNPFEVLGISKKLVKEIKYNDKALLGVAISMKKALALTFHPDVNSSPSASQRMLEINEAFDFIKKNQQTPLYNLLREEYVRGANEQKKKEAVINVKSVKLTSPNIRNVKIDLGLGKSAIIDTKGRFYTSKGNGILKREEKFIVGSLPTDMFNLMLYEHRKEGASSLALSGPNENASFPFTIPSEISDLVFNETIPEVNLGKYLVSGMEKKERSRTLDLFIEGQVGRYTQRADEFNMIGEIAEKGGSLELAILSYSEAGNKDKLISLGDRASKEGLLGEAVRAYYAADAFDSLMNLSSKCQSKDIQALIAAYLIEDKTALSRIGKRSQKKKISNLAETAFILANDSKNYLTLLSQNGRLEEMLDNITHDPSENEWLEEVGRRAIELAKEDKTKYSFAITAYNRLKSKDLIRKLGNIAFSRKHLEEAAKAFFTVQDSESYLKVLLKLKDYLGAYKIAQKNNDDDLLGKLFPQMLRLGQFDIAYKIAESSNDNKLFGILAKRSEITASKILNRHKKAAPGEKPNNASEEIMRASSLLNLAGKVYLNQASVKGINESKLEEILNLADKQIGLGDLKSAFKLVSKAEELICPEISYLLTDATKIGDMDFIGNILYSYSRYISVSNDYTSTRRISYDDLGRCAINAGNYTLAQSIAKIIDRKLGVSNERGTRSSLYVPIAEGLAINGDFTGALNIAAMTNPKTSDIIYESIGNIAISMGKKDDAVKYYEKISSKHKIRELKSRIRSNLIKPIEPEKFEPIKNKKDTLKRIKEKFSEFDLLTNSLIKRYSEIRQEAEKDIVSNRDLLFRVYNTLRLEGEPYQKMAELLETRGHHAEAIEASKRSKMDLNEIISKAYNTNADNLLKQNKIYASVPLYKKTKNFPMLLAIMKNYIKAPNEPGTSEMVSKEYILTGRFKAALDLVGFIKRNCKDEKILIKTDEYISHVAKLSEGALYQLLRESNPKNNELRESFLREMSRSYFYLDKPTKFIDRLPGVFRHVTERSYLELMSNEVYRVYEKIERERHSSPNIMRSMTNMAGFLESKGLYKQSAEFLRKTGNLGRELSCGDQALGAGKLLEAFDIYDRSGADKSRYMAFFDEAVRQNAKDYAEKAIYKLRHLVTNEERLNLAMRLSENKDLSDLKKTLYRKDK